MFRSIQWRITFWFFLLVLVSMAALGAYLTNSVRNTQLNSLHTRLENEAKMTAEASLPNLTAREGENNLDALAKKMGSQTGTRITIIALDGTVLAITTKTPRRWRITPHAPRLKTLWLQVSERAPAIASLSGRR